MNKQFVRYFTLYIKIVKILHIDDNKDITNLLSSFLKKKGFESEFTNDPMEGLKRIQEEKFDIVLLDISMPGFSGYNIINMLATNEVLQDQNIIVFSANNFPSTEIKGLLRRDGIKAVLKKPIQLSKVIETITS